jgi:hypothetical protein
VGKKPETNLIAGIDAHICDKCIEQAHGCSGRIKTSVVQN